MKRVRFAACALAGCLMFLLTSCGLLPRQTDAADEAILRVITLHREGEELVLTAVTAVLLVAVAWLVLKKVIRHPLGLCAAMLVLGGGIGNMIDRICRGYVVDMFDLEFMSYPIFNLADCFVVVGVILGAVYYLWFYDKYDGRKAKHDDGADSVQ